MIAALRFVARHGRWALVAGVTAGLTLPGLAAVLKPWIGHLIAFLLFLSAFRIGPRAALGGFGDLSLTLRTLALYQVAAPLLAVAATWALGVAATAPAMALVLLLSAPSVTGSPNFVIMLGRDPSFAMRLLLVGTALLPVTCIPVLWLSPALGGLEAVLASALRLIAVIAGAVGLAFALRLATGPDLAPRHREALDGAAALVLAVVVVGLMSAAGPALTGDPGAFFAWLGFACAVNFGGQVLAWRALPVPAPHRTSAAVVAGNRNIALYLVALPPPVAEKLLLFIGCYQLPMYLTPLVMRPLLARR